MNGVVPLADLEQSLYEVRRKIHPRAVSGTFARWRWGLVFFTQLVFYGLAWLPWNGRQAVLFDLASRKFYIFGLVLWPQDIIYLAVLLVASAVALFLFTAVAGRLWCGYACPQTVYTEIFMWIEQAIEGDHVARARLDRAPMGPRKAALRTAKHGAWLALSLWTGFTFVGYFTPIRDLVHGVAGLSLGGWETFWLFFYGLATYGNAGWMREQVCKHMCPYARFQSAMFDPHTLVIAYDAARGEPRGGRSRKADPAALGLGSCVDCNVCVQVCPTGIDIRDGLQYECIGCAACIDGCDQVMDKMGYAKGLIRYSTESLTIARVLRTRVVAYAAILAAITVAMATALWLRAPLKMDVIRDRAGLAREVDGGLVENVYRLQVMNTSEQPQVVELSVSGPLQRMELIAPSPTEIAPTTTRMIAVRVRADPGSAKGSQKIEFQLKAPQVHLREPSRFLIP